MSGVNSKYYTRDYYLSDCSGYELYKKFKPSLKPATYEEIVKGLPIKLARDASLNSFLWHQLKKGTKDLNLDE